LIYPSGSLSPRERARVRVRVRGRVRVRVRVRVRAFGDLTNKFCQSIRSHRVKLYKKC